MTEDDYQSNKEYLNEGNMFENNISLDNLEIEIRKVENGNYFKLSRNEIFYWKPK